MQKFVRTLLALALLVPFAAPADARDWYVSRSRGKGKKGTKEKPAKDLGNIVSKLEAGDTVHIAGGVYTGRGDNGSNTITVPVTIIGGYADDFSKRDPWGAHKTVFFGDNKTKNYTLNPSLYLDLMKYGGPNHPIRVDGIIVDHAGRNRYKTEKQHQIIMKANPATGENPTPAFGGIVIRVQKSEKFDQGPRWKITVENCVVMNSVTNQAAMAVSGYKGSEVVIRNNLLVNNAGFALFAGTKFHGDGGPEFLIENNTVLFTWRGPDNSETGASFGADTSLSATLKGNVFAFADRYGVNNGKNTPVKLINNNICGNMTVDYKEGATYIEWEDIEDEAEKIHEDSEDNVSEKIVIPVSKEWATLYASRVVIDREKLEAGVKAMGTPANELRSMLGLPVQGGKIDGPNSPVFVHRIQIEGALKAGLKQFGGRGCQKP